MRFLGYNDSRMKQRKWKLSMLLPVGLLSVIGAGLVVSSCNDADGQAAVSPKKAATKVLYVTIEPGRFHDYKAQKELFLEVSGKNEWETTVLTGSHHDVIEKLASEPNFADGYDVVVYNFCFAGCANLDVPYNIIEQTKTKGIPAMLIHCSLHSFWPTYKVKGENAVHAPGAPEKAHTKKELLAKWNKEHPGKAFPSWATFTGISSTKHGPKTPIKTKNLIADHGALKDVPEYETVNAELYNNFINAEGSKDSLPIMEGVQGKASSIILWEHPVGKSKTVSFTLGHSTAEWQQAEFQQVIKSTVNYLAENPSSAKK